MRKVKVILSVGCILIIMWIICFLYNVRCDADATNHSQVVPHSNDNSFQWPTGFTIKKCTVISLLPDTHKSGASIENEINWLDEAEKSGRVDRDVEKNFFRRIWLTIISLIVVSVIILLFVRIVYGKQGILPVFVPKDKMIKVIERQMLQPQKSIYLVDVVGKYVLLGISENKIECLLEVEADKIKEKMESIEDAARAQAAVPSIQSFDWKYIFPKPIMSLYNWWLTASEKKSKD